MKDVTYYLDLLKEKTGSDYQTAIKMGVDRTVISKIRSRNAIADENAVKIAELLEIDAGEVLLAAAMARSEGAVKTAWESIGKRAGIAAGVLLATYLGVHQNEIIWEGIQAQSGFDEFSRIYIMRSCHHHQKVSWRIP